MKYFKILFVIRFTKFVVLLFLLDLVLYKLLLIRLNHLYFIYWTLIDTNGPIVTWSKLCRFFFFSPMSLGS